MVAFFSLNADGSSSVANGRRIACFICWRHYTVAMSGLHDCGMQLAGGGEETS